MMEKKISRKPENIQSKIQDLGESQKRILSKQNELISEFKQQKGKEMSEAQLEKL